MSLSVAVAGASGYAGGELLRILSAHPDLEVGAVTANASAGDDLAAHQPQLRSLASRVLEPTTPEVLAGHDAVFLALPHGASGEIAASLPSDVLVVDCGADHRLASASDWSRFYPGEHAGCWPYGVPELPVAGGRQRDALAGARRIAGPGCNASAVALALAPGVAAGVVDASDVVAVLAVGPSGAGRSLRLPSLAAEQLGSAWAYGVGGTHRHIPEIAQSLVAAGAAAGSVRISFTPVLVPMSRGILATVTAPLAVGADPDAVHATWADAYAGERFVQVLPEGVFPRTADVLGANTALIGVTVDAAANRVVAVLALDNLAKGTAGAAVQSANIALGLDEAAGLAVDGVAP